PASTSASASRIHAKALCGSRRTASRAWLRGSRPGGDAPPAPVIAPRTACGRSGQRQRIPLRRILLPAGGAVGGARRGVVLRGFQLDRRGPVLAGEVGRRVQQAARDPLPARGGQDEQVV